MISDFFHLLSSLNSHSLGPQEAPRSLQPSTHFFEPLWVLGVRVGVEGPALMSILEFSKQVGLWDCGRETAIQASKEEGKTSLHSQTEPTLWKRRYRRDGQPSCVRDSRKA